MTIPDYPRPWQRAADLAAAYHAGQRSHDADTEYIAHPMRVAMIVACEFDCRDPEVLSAALLHDILEKTEIEPALLREEAGVRIAGIVEWLSKNYGSSENSYMDRLRAAPWKVRLIKMADALDHLDCMPGDLDERITKGQEVLELAFTDEEPIQRAKQCLAHALERASILARRIEGSGKN